MVILGRTFLIQTYSVYHHDFTKVIIFGIILNGIMQHVFQNTPDNVYTYMSAIFPLFGEELRQNYCC